MALSDDELIDLAKNMKDFEEDLHDVSYYQQAHSIVDGKDKVITKHLYFHYKNWSTDPVNLKYFVDFLKLENKNEKFILLNKQNCIIVVEKIVGDYVKKERERQKKERLRKISSIKS